ISGAFALSGDLQGSEDWYAWTVGADDAKHDWELSLTGLVTNVPSINIIDQSGATVLNNIGGSSFGQLKLEDMALDAGTYFLRISNSPDIPAPYVVSAVAPTPRQANQEEEPNEDPSTADAFDPSKPYRGRLTADQ